jgi:hypothetical protein
VHVAADRKARMREITREHNEYLRQLGLPELEV